MTTPVMAALAATAVLVGLLVLLVGAVALERARRTRWVRQDARRRAELTPLVHDLLDGTDGDLDSRALSATSLLDTMVLDLLPQLRGADRAALQHVLLQRGVVDQAAEELGARAPWRRGRALTSLGSAASNRHTPDIAALLDDEDAEVRCAAARALGKTGDVTAVGPLLGALTGAQAVPAGIVGMAVLDLGTPALPALRQALAHPDHAVRSLAAEVLGVHGDSAVVFSLTQIVADDRSRAELRRTAAEALGRIGARSATPTLCAVLGSPRRPALRAAAAMALGRIGDPAGLDALVVVMGTAEAQVSAACAEALATAGAPGRSRLTALAETSAPVGALARAAVDSLLPVECPRMQEAVS